ncbi:unnamed protein product, partial [Prorocentrum cordatum]
PTILRGAVGQWRSCRLDRPGGHGLPHGGPRGPPGRRRGRRLAAPRLEPHGQPGRRARRGARQRGGGAHRRRPGPGRLRRGHQLPPDHARGPRRRHGAAARARRGGRLAAGMPMGGLQLGRPGWHPRAEARAGGLGYPEELRPSQPQGQGGVRGLDLPLRLPTLLGLSRRAPGRGAGHADGHARRRRGRGEGPAARGGLRLAGGALRARGRGHGHQGREQPAERHPRADRHGGAPRPEAGRGGPRHRARGDQQVVGQEPADGGAPARGGPDPPLRLRLQAGPHAQGLQHGGQHAVVGGDAGAPAAAAIQQDGRRRPRAAGHRRGLHRAGLLGRAERRARPVMRPRIWAALAGLKGAAGSRLTTIGVLSSQNGGSGRAGG